MIIMHRRLEEAASGGNLQALIDLLDLDAQNIRAQTMEENTVLHLLAANGEGHDFEACANNINDRDGNLLSAQNKNGDTPLHLAARAGKPSMVSHLIDLARRAGKMVELLRKENDSKETALHEAVRIGDHGIVLKLLEADEELARFPEDGTSPLYLAVLLKLNSIVQTLHDKSKDNDLSFSGPNGQTALHAAVLRGPELTKKLLQWNGQMHKDKDLTAKKDEKGSTPLHFAAGLPVYFAAGLPVCFAAGLLKAVQNLESVCWQVFRDNTDALYEPDIDGLFPIHVAASVGAVQTVALFVEKCGKSAGLRDAKGRTFLHIAAEKNKLCVVRYASRSPSLTWIMNMRDKDGNTAMHLAVQAGNLLTFSALFGSRHVNLNLPNANGQTPRDIAQYKVPPRLSFDLNSDSLIRHSLNMANASSGACRGDHFRGGYEDVQSGYEIKELGMLKDSTQTLSVGSVLIATVTFGATFSLPGGYRADDHIDGGTPTLAPRYAFLAFMMANAIAFICSSVATVGFMYSGSPMVRLGTRIKYIDISIYFMQAAITSLTAAFALAMYTVLAPVAPKTAIAICIFGSLVIVYSTAEFMLKAAYLVGAFWVRMGPTWTLIRTMAAAVLSCLVFFWPLILVFSWAAYQSKHPMRAFP